MGGSRSAVRRWTLSTRFASVELSPSTSPLIFLSPLYLILQRGNITSCYQMCHSRRPALLGAEKGHAVSVKGPGNPLSDSANTGSLGFGSSLSSNSSSQNSKTPVNCRRIQLMLFVVTALSATYPAPSHLHWAHRAQRGAVGFELRSRV